MGEYGGPATSCQPQAWATIKSWLFFLITLAQCNQYGLRPSSFFFSRKDASAFLVRKYAVDLEQAELEAKQLGRAVEEAEQLAAVEAVTVAVALEAVADWGDKYRIGTLPEKMRPQKQNFFLKLFVTP